MVNKIYINFTPFHVATEKSTAAPGEETTAVPSGKTPNNMEKEMKIFVIEISWVFQCSFSQLWNVQLGYASRFCFM